MNAPIKKIATRWPAFSEEEAEAVRRVIKSNKVNYWTGDECRLFEREFAAWCATDYAIALTNGTLALELALKALGIGPGDEVVVTPRSFIASASCVVTVGADPVFADVDRDTQNITAATIAAALSPRTKAIVCVHLAGMPCDMGPIMELARKHDLYVVEDCAQAHGAKYDGKPVGSIGDIGVWSFCQDKIMTTGGEGGMVTTSDAALMHRMWSYKDHGKRLETVRRHHAPGFRWLHESFGSNFRMLEMQAVIGRIQLGKIENWSSQRRANAEQIWMEARECPGLRVPDIPSWATHAAYRAYVFVEVSELADGLTRDDVIALLGSAGVPAMVGTCPEIYREKAFSHTPWVPKHPLPVAAELASTALMLFTQPTLSEDEVRYMCDSLRTVMLNCV